MEDAAKVNDLIKNAGFDSFGIGIHQPLDSVNASRRGPQCNRQFFPTPLLALGTQDHSEYPKLRLTKDCVLT